MQDNEIATIFGEDVSTGAGGANVVEYTKFLQPAAPTYFKPFPNSKFSDAAALDARIGWRQSIRVLKNLYLPIEDNGVTADVTKVLPTTQDLLDGSFSSTQFQVIADRLKDIGVQTGKNGMVFQTIPDLQSEASLGTPSSFKVNVAGIAKVQVFSNGTALGESFTLASLAPQTTTLSFDPKITKVGYQSFDIRGFNAAGKALFVTKRIGRYLPNKEDYISLAANTTLPVDLAKYGSIYNLVTSDGDGFVAGPAGLVVGGGIIYANGVNSQASFFATSATPFKVAFDITYDTEEGFDYVKIGYKTLGNAIVQLIPGSGASGSGKITQSFDIPATGEVEVFVQFTSDNGEAMKGVTISSVKLVSGDGSRTPATNSASSTTTTSSAPNPTTNSSTTGSVVVTFSNGPVYTTAAPAPIYTTAAPAPVYKTPVATTDCTTAAPVGGYTAATGTMEEPAIATAAIYSSAQLSPFGLVSVVVSLMMMMFT